MGMMGQELVLSPFFHQVAWRINSGSLKSLYQKITTKDEIKWGKFQGEGGEW